MAIKTKAKDVRLGQEVYVLVATGGEVERTMVGIIAHDDYHFLNGTYSSRSHWFSFDQALSIADEQLRERETQLRAQLRAVAQQRRRIKSEEYRTSVMDASYRVVDLRDIEKRSRTRRLKHVRVPSEYLNPDHTVYVVITPSTRGYGDLYRPHSHFVLETKVRSVCFSPDGVVHYTFSTRFDVDEFHPTREEASAKLQTTAKLPMGSAIHFVSGEEEKRELDKIEDIPF